MEEVAVSIKTETRGESGRRPTAYIYLFNPKVLFLHLFIVSLFAPYRVCVINKVVLYWTCACHSPVSVQM